METPKFYHYAKASGLVKEELLDEMLRQCEGRDPEYGAASSLRSILNGLGSTKADGLEHFQHIARLRYGRRKQDTPVSSEESETRDDSDASLDGETRNLDEDGITSLDKRLSGELVRRGVLNRWQTIQLMEGRTKFTLGDYRILDAIGRGGYGHVFLGREDGDALKKQADGDTPVQSVAIKVLPLAKTTPELTERFLHEINVQKNLRHPNLVRFLASGRDGNVHYMVHEFVDGGDARLLLRHEGGLRFDLAATIVSQTARALQYLHEQGVVHRDVKPANVLLSSDGHAKLTDLGLAVLFDPGSATFPVAASGENRIDKVGKVAGTVDYMAPDQIQTPSKPSPAWDVYSLGCMFYQLLTGTVPFPSGDSKQKIYAHLRTRPADPRTLNQDIPYAIVEMLSGMMHKEPEHRIRTAREVAERLAPWLPPSGLADQLAFDDAAVDDAEPPFVPFTHAAVDPHTIISIPGQ